MVRRFGVGENKFFILVFWFLCFWDSEEDSITAGKRSQI
jgi:hypothetical protein